MKYFSLNNLVTTITSSFMDKFTNESKEENEGEEETNEEKTESKLCAILGSRYANTGHSLLFHISSALIVYLPAGVALRGYFYAAYLGGADSWRTVGAGALWCLVAAPLAHLLLAFAYYRFGHPWKTARRAARQDK